MSAHTATGRDPFLAPWATDAGGSRGRRFPEDPPAHRTEFQRDRDRIVHSAAFRRLEYKTQVFVNHEGDLFRTRLTHSLEVAQIARTVARALRLNEDLTEAICLAHDLGHTPFGHAGQEALHACMRGHGGFEHNLQSLRVVDELEHKYADFRGLNLTFEAREGILKHCSRDKARELGELGRRFLERRQPSLEAQLANVADEIAYNNHDVDDGLRAGLLSIEQLRDIALFESHHAEVRERYPRLAGRPLIHETIRRMINGLVVDLIEHSDERIRKHAPADPEAVRAADGAMIGFSDAVAGRNRELKRFLRRELYQHYRVHRMTCKAQRIVRDLYAAFADDPRLLPPQAREQALALAERHGDDGRARAVADYIAGMTDRFAIAEHERLFLPRSRT
ncbi:MAG TPA: deoxyguanosinetriphosphate triphosphohydrolase [Gammaproteobacteria bacterium]|nr:deoxyguanosinetriphosphate triphosphohydrolase [Gammaproteobacteria bacterium]